MFSFVSLLSAFHTRLVEREVPYVAPLMFFLEILSSFISISSAFDGIFGRSQAVDVAATCYKCLRDVVSHYSVYEISCLGFVYCFVDMMHCVVSSIHCEKGLRFFTRWQWRTLLVVLTLVFPSDDGDALFLLNGGRVIAIWKIERRCCEGLKSTSTTPT